MPPFPVVSLLDMLRLQADHLFQSLANVHGVMSEWNLLGHFDRAMNRSPVPDHTKIVISDSIEHIRGTALELGMATTARVIDAGWDEFQDILSTRAVLAPQQLALLSSYLDRVSTTFMAESDTRSFMILPPAHAPFLTAEAPHFGEQVDDAFPSASQEIADAGRCRATGMWTAMVMHLMRALEDALAALSRHVGIEPTQNWNTALNQIDAKLKEHNKRSCGEDGEQWAAETSAHLRNIKNAWRNHAAHGRARYNEGEAVAIWNNVRALLQTLAKRLEE